MNSNPCVVDGVDRGEILYSLYLFGWLGVITIQAGMVATAIWAVLFLVYFGVGVFGNSQTCRARQGLTGLYANPARPYEFASFFDRERPVTLKARVIPCLDVKDGRVVKGVNFVDLIDAGDPVEASQGL